MTKIVLFGDSITAGYTPEQPVSDQLDKVIKRELSMRNLEVPEILNEGIPGNTSADGLRRLESDVLAKNPDLVTIFFGANDCNQERNISVETYRKNLFEMIEKIGQEKVLLLTAPYVHQRPERPTEKVLEYVTAAKQIGEQTGVPTVDLYQLMSVYPAPEEFLQRDGIHFSKEGYDFLGALIVRELKTKVSAKEG